MIERSLTSLGGACVGLIAISATSSFAADMSTDELRRLLVGRTYYLDVAAGGTLANGGQATLYFAPDGTVLNRIPSGKIQQGTWTIKDDAVCVAWKDLPPNPCSKYDKQGDVVTVINLATGQPRGKISKTADGNAENLKP